MNFTLKVWRQKNAKDKGHFETYKVENISADSSFLEMMDILNEQLIREGNNPVALNKGCHSSEWGGAGRIVISRAPASRTRRTLRTGYCDR